MKVPFTGQSAGGDSSAAKRCPTRDCLDGAVRAGQGTARAESVKELMHQTSEVTQACCRVISTARYRMNHRFLCEALPLPLTAGAGSFLNKYRGFGVN